MKFYMRYFINEGGAFGHMLHPFEDYNLKFSDLKEIIKRSLQGSLDVEGPVTEKLDGQALSISWKDGHLVGARNKGHLRQMGAHAMDLQEISRMFENENIRKMYREVFQNLENALKNAPNKEEIFQNGRRWINIEILYPSNPNVIPYDDSVTRIVFLNGFEVGEDGNKVQITQDEGWVRKLVPFLKKESEKSVQKYLSVPEVKLSKLTGKNFEKKQNEFFSKLNKIKGHLSDSATIEDYLLERWSSEIINPRLRQEARSRKELLDLQTLKHLLLKRWVKGQKSGESSLGNLKRAVPSDKFFLWIKKIDKEASDLTNSFLYDLKLLFLQLGVEVMRNLSSLLVADPDKSVRKIKQDLEKEIRKVGKINPKNIDAKEKRLFNRFQSALDLLQKLGGLESVVPMEGISFVYKGKLYKLTGSFAPLNQLLGIFRYRR